MLNTIARRLRTIAILAISTSSLHATIINLGSGPDTSYFTLESPNIGTQTYAISYTYNSVSPQDAFFLFDAILSESSTGVSASISNFGTPSDPNFFVNSITFSGTTETNTSGSPFVPSWTHWAASGEAGFPTSSAIPSNTWTLGSGISSPFRLITPESNDALRFSDFSTTPSIDPIPEPSSLLLLAASCVAFLRRKRVE